MTAKEMLGSLDALGFGSQTTLYRNIVNKGKPGPLFDLVAHHEDGSPFEPYRFVDPIKAVRLP